MWRFLMKVYGRSAILNSEQCSRKLSTVKIHFCNQYQERLLCSTVVRNIGTLRAAINEAGTEYIIQYRPELENPDPAEKIIDALRTKFHLTNEKIELILSNEIVLKNCREKSFLDTIDLLYVEGVAKQNLVEYPWLITLTKKTLVAKVSLLKSLNGFRNINDFVPLLRLQVPRMRKLVSALNRETEYKAHGNRLYFIADRLNVLPCVVSKFLAKRLFVLEMPAEMFETNLEHMIKYNVEPMNILKDLWGFRYKPNSVEMRLKRALLAKKDKIMPWMVRCPEPILQKSLQLSLDELQVLGDKKSVAEYIGDRLGFSTEDAKAIMGKHPQVNTVRVTKVKEVLDYLLDEAKFTRHEIAQVPRVLCHSLETTKERIEELKKYGCRPTSLVIVCRSKREYQKFLLQWQRNSQFYKSVEDVSKKEDEQ